MNSIIKRIHVAGKYKGLKWQNSVDYILMTKS